MPSTFVTLTMDDTTEFRWAEVKDLEESLNTFNECFTAVDAPVECSALFQRKVKDFLREFILPSSSKYQSQEIFERVLHFFVRYVYGGLFGNIAKHT